MPFSPRIFRRTCKRVAIGICCFIVLNGSEEMFSGRSGASSSATDESMWLTASSAFMCVWLHVYLSCRSCSSVFGTSTSIVSSLRFSIQNSIVWSLKTFLEPSISSTYLTVPLHFVDVHTDERTLIALFLQKSIPSRVRLGRPGA